MQTIRFKSLNLSNDDFLLDMGCGEGRHSIGAYIETKVNVLGFDLSINDLRIAIGRLDDFDTSSISNYELVSVSVVVAFHIPDSLQKDQVQFCAYKM